MLDAHRPPLSDRSPAMNYNSLKISDSEAPTDDSAAGKAGDDGESKDSGAPGLGAVAAHYALLPWKLLFATIPPTIFLGGWACFIVSLVYIGLLTGLIGDIATMVGCCFSMPPAITAITPAFGSAGGGTLLTVHGAGFDHLGAAVQATGAGGTLGSTSAARGA